MYANRRPMLLSICICSVLIASWYYFHFKLSRVHGYLANMQSGRKPSLGFDTSSNTANTDLIMYSYYETEEAKTNLAFFLAHALHSAADFIFVLNGAHTVSALIGNATAPHDNMHVIERENRCFDLGGFHAILTAKDAPLLQRYRRFIMLNASLRGPFLPPWARRSTCWSDEYWAPLATSAQVKLVGMSWNCANAVWYPTHLQSMILATDRETLRDVLLPRLRCFETKDDAIKDGETKLSSAVMEAGYEAVAMTGRFAAHAGENGRDARAFLNWCIDQPGRSWSGGNDIQYSGAYEGTTLHPFETMFAKTNRDWDERDRRVLDVLTERADLQRYSSFDSCGSDV